MTNAESKQFSSLEAKLDSARAYAKELAKETETAKQKERDAFAESLGLRTELRLVTERLDRASLTVASQHKRLAELGGVAKEASEARNSALEAQAAAKVAETRLTLAEEARTKAQLEVERLVREDAESKPLRRRLRERGEELEATRTELTNAKRGLQVALMELARSQGRVATLEAHAVERAVADSQRTPQSISPETKAYVDDLLKEEAA